MNHSPQTQTLRRTLHPQIRMLDEPKGLVEYVASDETLDSYREIVRAAGARFTRFAKNAPFVDSHNYDSIDCLLGKVVDYGVKGRQVVETVQWAIDVPENKLAQYGFAMCRAGYLPAVSIGFMPVSSVSKWDANPTGFQAALAEMKIPTGTDVRAIYLEWEQMELSTCVIGANPNAVARAYKAGVLDDAALELFSNEHSRRETANSTDSPAAVEKARQRARTVFLLELEQTIKKI